MICDEEIKKASFNERSVSEERAFIRGANFAYRLLVKKVEEWLGENGRMSVCDLKAEFVNKIYNIKNQ